MLHFYTSDTDYVNIDYDIDLTYDIISQKFGAMPRRCSASTSICQGSEIPEFNPWSLYKVGKRLLPPQSCPLTSTHVP